MNLVAALDRAARATPGKPFLRHDGETITYAQARDRSHRAAAVLSALGVAAGDRVAAMCFNTPAFVDLLFGAWRLGAAFVPVNHKLQAAEIDYVLAHSGSKAILFDASLAPVLERVAHPAQRLVTDGAPACRASTRCSRQRTASPASSPPTAISRRSSTRPARPAARRAACTAIAR